MRGRVAYLDTSAYAKFGLWEAETEPLSSAVARWPIRASSVLLSVEAVRAVGRREQGLVDAVHAGLAHMLLLPVNDAVIARAQVIGDPSLRTLDAIHLASAEMLGDDLGMVFTYDRRMADAATALGLPVSSPT